MNAETVDNAGTPQSKLLVMENIKKFPRGISDQVISKEPATAGNQRAPGPGLQVSSAKPQAPSSLSVKRQASSPKHKGSSAKPQASSSRIEEPGKSFTAL